MNRNLAKDLLIQFPGDALQEEDIDVANVTQVSGSEAIAETTLKTAFRLEKAGGAWVIREVRLGHGQWEKVDNLVRTLEIVKTQETADMLDKIAAAVQRYREANGSLPVFVDYVGLSDLLSPRHLTPLIRLDSWRRPFAARRTGGDIEIMSSGPDGRFGTADDMLRTVSEK